MKFEYRISTLGEVNENNNYIDKSLIVLEIMSTFGY